MMNVFILKDANQDYVGVNSISYDELTRNYIYSFSPQLLNGYNTYTDETDANNQLKLLQEKGQKIKFGMDFHIEKINMVEVINKENRIGKVETLPVKHKIINVKISMPLEDMEKYLCGTGG